MAKSTTRRQFPPLGAGVARVETPVGDAIESHRDDPRGGKRQDDQHDDTPRYRLPVRRDYHAE